MPEEFLAADPFLADLGARIAGYDLLRHPFYQAWTAGELTRNDLRAYAGDYYHHVAAFPTYLSALHSRMPDGAARREVLRNLAGEEIQGRPHSELWLDFAEATGGVRTKIAAEHPVAEIGALIAAYRGLAHEAAPATAIAAFYAYESQVPRIATAKYAGLRERYGISERGAAYFKLHASADIAHSNTWARLLHEMVSSDAQLAAPALDAAEAAAAQLWRALDGIDRERQVRAA